MTFIPAFALTLTYWVTLIQLTIARLLVLRKLMAKIKLKLGHCPWQSCWFPRLRLSLCFKRYLPISSFLWYCLIWINNNIFCLSSYSYRAVSISACASTHPTAIVLRYLQRKAIMMDPQWQRGHYYTGDKYPSFGMKLARLVKWTFWYNDGLVRQTVRAIPLTWRNYNVNICIM